MEMTGSPRISLIITLGVGAAAFAARGGTETNDAAVPQPSNRLLVEYVDPSLLRTNVSPLRASQSLGLASQSGDKSARWQIVAVRRSPTSTDRRQQFETDFGIQNKEPTLALGSVQTAKYQLDSTTFAAQEIAKSFEFEYQLRDMWTYNPSSNLARRSYSDPFRDMLDHSRFNTSLKLNDAQVGGAAFIGLKLSMPFGD